MTGNAFRHVYRGEKVHNDAKLQNAVVDLVNSELMKKQNQSSQVAQPVVNPSIIYVRNDSSADVGAFYVLALGDLIITPQNESAFKQHIVMAGIEPVAGYEGRFAVLLEPLAPGKIGKAIVDGICQVRVYIDAETETSEFADISDGEFVLRPVADGTARLIWAQDIIGEQWAIVRLGQVSAPAAGAFPVTLQVTGGVNGTDSTPATYRYTIKDLAGNTVATNFDAAGGSSYFRRPSVGWMEVATAGIGYYNGFVFMLLWCNEYPEQSNCDYLGGP